MTDQPAYGLYHRDRGWCIDTGGGEGAWTGFDTYDDRQTEAKTWKTPQEALIEIEACELELGVVGRDFEIVLL